MLGDLGCRGLAHFLLGNSLGRVSSLLQILQAGEWSKSTCVLRGDLGSSRRHHSPSSKRNSRCSKSVYLFCLVPSRARLIGRVCENNNTCSAAFRACLFQINPHTHLDIHVCSPVRVLDLMRDTVFALYWLSGISNCRNRTALLCSCVLMQSSDFALIPRMVS